MILMEIQEKNLDEFQNKSDSYGYIGPHGCVLMDSADKVVADTGSGIFLIERTDLDIKGGFAALSQEIAKEIGCEKHGLMLNEIQTYSRKVNLPVLTQKSI